MGSTRSRRLSGSGRHRSIRARTPCVSASISSSEAPGTAGDAGFGAAPCRVERALQAPRDGAAALHVVDLMPDAAGLFLLAHPSLVFAAEFHLHAAHLLALAG